ncbi:MAG: hypothetical protein ACR2JW_22550 [Thermomicrobiales bacterium]
MTESAVQATPTERIYALLADTSAVTVLATGGYGISLAVEETIMSAPWQIVLAAMAVPILAAMVASCGNHREKPHVRAATWGIVVLLSIVNPIAWFGILVIIARLHVRSTQQHATGD